MPRELPEILEFVQSCKRLGAVSVDVGDVRVRFDGAPPDEAATREPTEEELRKKNEELTFWSSE